MGFESVEKRSRSELLETWINGNRADVADYLTASASGASETAHLAVTFFRYSDEVWADWRTLASMLESRAWAAAVAS